MKKKSQSCEAWLYIGEHSSEGSTGRDHGHAEMDALHNFIDESGGVGAAVALIAAAEQKGVYCPSRPCCLKCSTVLRGLGFQPISNKNSQSSFSNVPMGSTEWGCSLNVRDLMDRILGKGSYKKVLELA